VWQRPRHAWHLSPSVVVAGHAAVDHGSTLDDDVEWWAMRPCLWRQGDVEHAATLLGGIFLPTRHGTLTGLMEGISIYGSALIRKKW
jgi:hypothetical protein